MKSIYPIHNQPTNKLTTAILHANVSLAQFSQILRLISIDLCCKNGCHQISVIWYVATYDVKYYSKHSS